MKWSHAFGAATAVALALGIGACGGGNNEKAAAESAAKPIATAPDGQVMAPGAVTPVVFPPPKGSDSAPENKARLVG